jgi:hypothetical protein
MYHPYFRGKQFELITIRETATLMAAAKFTPIIEPVKESLSGLQRALKTVCDASGKAIVIVNPRHGDHADDGVNISTLLKDEFLSKDQIAAGLLLSPTTTLEEAIECCKAHAEHDIAVIHAGFNDAKGLAEALGDEAKKIRHIFFDSCSLLYRKHFAGAHRVLLRDGFKRRVRNRDYPPVEPFSDLHVTYDEQGMGGFGDFLMVGDEFLEGGGPAYAVAIHLTFIDPTKDDEMFIYHFVSTSQDDPTDPGGKFGQALGSLMKKLTNPNNHIFESSAVAEFRDLHARGHFPGLGHIKKLSMKHHIETLQNYFA